MGGGLGVGRVTLSGGNFPCRASVGPTVGARDVHTLLETPEQCERDE